ADGRAVSLRRVGRPMSRPSGGGREGDGIENDMLAPGRLSREIAGHGADAVVLEPATLRADVVSRLTAQAHA
nr:WYL domain-containing protein [Mycobacterium sp.]